MGDWDKWQVHRNPRIISLPPDIWNAIPSAEKRRINDERRQYRDNKRQRISEVGYVPPANNVQNDGASSVAGSTIGPVGVNRVATNPDTNINEFQGSIMGGRHEQIGRASCRERVC